ncbi:MAG: Mu-like prophage major head subunit gpT family protein [Alphaproteobacteria bacterium]|jgi:phage major head subunit gpT-like protein|nr:Mu-like prophage major head subunit gpT family protein [Alphaproteobacteria bacterium]
MRQLSSRAIIGTFYKKLNQSSGLEWVGAISNYFNSDQDSEDYRWIGQSPVMREWVGGRNAKGFNSNGIKIENKHFEATIEIPVKHLRRDKTGQVKARIGELAQRTNSHWAKLLTHLISKGESEVCYDNSYFFDTTHKEGKSGVQSNKITVNLNSLDINGEVGVPNAPSEAAFRSAILKAVQQIVSFKDDQGEPMNENANKFLVVVPTHLWFIAKACLSVPLSVGGATNPVKVLSDLDIAVAQNSRLDWTNKFCVIRTDGEVKAFIRQEEEPVQVKAKAEGSEFEFDNDAHQYGVDTWRNVGYGYWQHACLVNITKS